MTDDLTRSRRDLVHEDDFEEIAIIITIAVQKSFERERERDRAVNEKNGMKKREINCDIRTLSCSHSRHFPFLIHLHVYRFLNFSTCVRVTRARARKSLPTTGLIALHFLRAADWQTPCISVLSRGCCDSRLTSRRNTRTYVRTEQLRLCKTLCNPVSKFRREDRRVFVRQWCNPSYVEIAINLLNLFLYLPPHSPSSLPPRVFPVNRSAKCASHCDAKKDHLKQNYSPWLETLLFETHFEKKKFTLACKHCYSKNIFRSHL